MLRNELERAYFVYPSWADLSYRWQDLPQLMADPLSSRYVEDPRQRKMDYWKQLDYPEKIKPPRFIDGPGGNGIIVTEIAPGERWLPGLILRKEANLCSPTGLRPTPAIELGYKVCYLEPYDAPEWQLLTGKKPKLYVLGGATTEHIESDPDTVYWAVMFKKSRQRLKGLSDLPAWSRHLGLSVIPLDAPPNPVQEETADWFRNPERDTMWFRVESPNQNAGFHFAIALYIGLHLRYVGGRRVSCIHVLSGFENRLNFRRNWHFR